MFCTFIITYGSKRLANFQQTSSTCILNTFAGSLLDRVNTLLYAAARLYSLTIGQIPRSAERISIFLLAIIFSALTLLFYSCTW